MSGLNARPGSSPGEATKNSRISGILFL
jgi:hypothetical protein